MRVRAEEIVGRPYLEGGRDAGSLGLDCYGVVRVGLSDLGVEIPRDQADAVAREFALGRVLAAWEPTRVGDVLVLEAEAGPHVGLAISPFRFVHATRTSGVVVDRVAVWARAGKLRRRVRVRELEEGGRGDG